LLRGGELLAERAGEPGGTGAGQLLPAIDALLRGAGVAAADVEAFAVAVGPGSFTGLRVGVATVKGLAFGSGRPVAAVPTLAALARAGAEGSLPCVALLDARRGELYAAGYRADADELWPADPAEGCYTPEELAPRLPAACRLVGEGVRLAGARLCALRGGGIELGPPLEPRAREVGLLGQRLLERGEGMDAAELVPRYVRRAEAEVRRTGRRFE
jgi:tRNA threonylcarbamoyladenosine biosynthesis protein TsaB